MTTLAWIVVIAGGWLLLAVAGSLLFGRVIRLRDRDRPHKPPHVERPHRRRPQDWPSCPHRLRDRDRPHKPPHVERPHRRRPQDWLSCPHRRRPQDWPPGGHR